MSKDFRKMHIDSELAAANISLLAAFEMFYGPVPKELVEFIYAGVRNQDYNTPPPRLVALAKMRALHWLADQQERLGTPSSKGSKSPWAIGAQPDVASDTKGTGQPK